MQYNQHMLEIYIKVSYNISGYEKYGRKENYNENQS